MPSEKRIFFSESQGMNLDLEQRVIPNGQTRDRRNITSSVNGNKLCISNIEGNYEIVHTLPTGSNICIGTKDDKLNSTVYNFIWNGSGNHSIVRWQYSLVINTVTELVKGVGLAFEFDKLITGIAIVNSRFLIWGQQDAEIGCLDLTTYATLPSPLTTTDRHFLELYKIPLPTPVYARFFTDFARQDNGLTSKLYKFRVRYIYEGNFRTFPSTYARLATPLYDFARNSRLYIPSNTLDNGISIYVPPPAYSDVKTVELWVQAGNSDDAMGDWGVLASIPMASMEYGQSIVYTGREALEVVDQQEALMPYSFLPKGPKAVELLPNNSLAVSNFPENMEADITPKVQGQPVYVGKPIAVGAVTTTATYTKTVGTMNDNLINENFNIELTNAALAYDTITIGGTPRQGDVIVLPLICTYAGAAPTTLVSPSTFTIRYVVTSEDVIGATAAANQALIAARLTVLINCIDTRSYGFGGIIAYYGGSGSVLRIVEGTNLRNAPYTISTTADVTGASPVALSVIVNYPSATYPYEVYATHKCFKMGAYHPIFISYEDAKGRRTPAIPCGSIYIPFVATLAFAQLRIFINHLAPNGAVRYHILHAKPQEYSKYVQMWALAAEDVGIPDQWSIALPKAVSDFGDEYSSSSLEYTYVAGDRMRILAYEAAGVITFPATPFDTSIIDVTGSPAANLLISADLNGAGVTTLDHVLAEVYRPATAPSPFCYEIGYTGTVDANHFHVGNVQTQTGSLAAIILMTDAGDSYYKFRYASATAATGLPNPYQFVESQDFSDFFISKVTDQGRASTVDTIALQTAVRSVGIYHTQPFVADTALNGLSIVLGTSYNEFALGYGAIQFMRARDYTLLVWFEDRVGYVGILRELLLTSTGTQTYKTDVVVNSMNYYDYEGGISTNPESHANDGTRDYWVDAKRNKVLRLSNDGITTISDYGIQKWVAENLDVKDNIYTDRKIFGTYDERNEKYIAGVSDIIEFTSFSGASEVGGVNTITLTKTSLNLSVTLVVAGTSVMLSGLGIPSVVTVITATYPNNNSVTITWVGGVNALGVEGPNSALVIIGVLTFVQDSLGTDAASERSYWDCFLDLPAEMLGTAGNDWISFKNGKMYLQNQRALANGTANYNKFFGTTVESQVDVVFNQEASKMKLWENIMQESNAAWDSDVNGDISNEKGQQSSLLATDYKELLPGQFSSYFLRDVNTPNVSNPLTAGDWLISPSLKVRLKTNSTSEVKLFAVTAFTTESKL